ncbi:kinase-like domain-containing protein [Mycena maculata]|uniref:Kinase-like domain-containing protein n=1 Tax=Mycena maculata TaxID=230809 RepID=A0AAD7MMC1_9AGAR|nr:kinase-like domain-containing protein [Mycena maculata]
MGGEEVEVVLRVLKIFQDQSDDGWRVVRQKFAEEALVWWYLKHPNIVPFLGLDGTTFSSPTMAMLADVIQSLVYLHSENIVHGDLCGSKPRCGGSTRWMAPELLPSVYQPGMPFRRTPASDVWAFGCVCCEIWSEGEVPFTPLSDGAIVMALSHPDSADGVTPYGTKPLDKTGSLMPHGLWELVQLCFTQSHPATRC